MFDGVVLEAFFTLGCEHTQNKNRRQNPVHKACNHVSSFIDEQRCHVRRADVLNTFRGRGDRDLAALSFVPAESKIGCFYSTLKCFFFCSVFLSRFLTLSKRIKSTLTSKLWQLISCWLKSVKHNLPTHLHNPFLLNASAGALQRRPLSFQSRGTPEGDAEVAITVTHSLNISSLDYCCQAATDISVSDGTIIIMGESDKHFVCGKQTPQGVWCSSPTRSTTSFWMPNRRDENGK